MIRDEGKWTDPLAQHLEERFEALCRLTLGGGCEFTLGGPLNLF
jgi:hypothetical protein